MFDNFVYIGNIIKVFVILISTLYVYRFSVQYACQWPENELRYLLRTYQVELPS